MATLTNAKIKETYQGLIKTNDNNIVSGTNQYLTDGFGNITPLSVGTNNIGIGTTSPSYGYKLEVSADILVNSIRVGRGGGNITTNTAVGVSALNNNTTGYYNTAVGVSALNNNTTGALNTALGRYALYYNTTASNNTAVGVNALFYNTTGITNTAVGTDALFFNTTGINNTALGFAAGRRISNGTNQTITNNSVFIGQDTRALADSQTNQIVIGHQAIGVGSNSVVLGNDSIVKTILKGDVGIGTTIPGYKLDVSGAIRGEQYLRLADTGGTNRFSIRAESTFGTIDNGTNALNYNANYHLFLVGLSERMRITNTGNVSIGNQNNTYKLDVSGTGRFTSTVTATDFITSSDLRLKKNIQDYSFDKKINISLKTYEFISDGGRKRYGVIAQDLEKTNPEFVITDEQGFKSVSYIDLLIAKIAELENRLKTLEN